ncbi:MAG TPA: DUF3303 family protein [Thermomicrobiaceae bacterium]|nr:DUF3303 family protein [Thermomicrobiaceae bacterium]
MALYQCSWRWPDQTARHDSQTRAEAFARIFRAAEALDPLGERLRGWFSYPGEVAGFLLVEAANHEELGQCLAPYCELMQFDVHPVVQVDYRQFSRDHGV